MNNFRRQDASFSVVAAGTEILPEVSTVSITFHVLNLNLEAAAATAELLAAKQNGFTENKKKKKKRRTFIFHKKKLRKLFVWHLRT